MSFKNELLENFKIALEKLPDNIYEDCQGTYDLKLEFYQLSEVEEIESLQSYNFEFVELDNNTFQLEDYSKYSHILKEHYLINEEIIRKELTIFLLDVIKIPKLTSNIVDEFIDKCKKKQKENENV